MNLFHSLLVIAALGQGPVDRSESMLRLATADQPLVNSAVVPAPLRDVWRAWTRSEEITKWMVPAGKIDLRIGGELRTSYTAGSDLTGPDVIVNQILAFDPERMITIRNTKTPERFPFKNAMAKCWTVIYFEPAGEGKTRVTTRMIGFTAEEESVKMKAFFDQGNQATLDALVKRFSR